MKNYTTQLLAARNGIVTVQMEQCAKREGMTAEELCEKISKGVAVIPCNVNHTSIIPCAVGEGLQTKVNVNIGVSGDVCSYESEMQKVSVALEYGADAIMDLSNCGKTEAFRKKLIEKSSAMIGTVPVYDAVGYLDKELFEITAEEFLSVLRAHARQGVDFMTIHAGLNRRCMEKVLSCKRKMDIVSRGGALLFAWMLETGNENPFYEHFDEVLDIFAQYDVTASLGDGLRPGCIDDGTDIPQISELIELGLLTQRAQEKGVQVMIEGPGHIPLNDIAANIALQKRLCKNAPFYVLGPIVTDIAPGYDHITSAIGGAVAAASGADFLCYVTPAEHLCLPNADDVKEGLIASKIAAHSADIAKGIPHARERDGEMALARRRVDFDKMFDLAIDKEKAVRYYERSSPSEKGTCTMCGKMCAVKTVDKALERLAQRMGE